MSVELYFRDFEGEPCGPGDNEALSPIAGSSPTTKELDEGGNTWNLDESGITVESGNWEVRIHYDSGDNSADPQLNVSVQRRNSSCVVQQTIIDETLILSRNQTGALVSTTPVNPGAVLFNSGDIVVVILDLVNEDVPVDVRYNGPNPGNDDSRLIRPDHNGDLHHSTDTLVTDEHDLSHTTDTMIMLPVENLHTTDSLIAAPDQTMQHSTDIQIRPTGDETFHWADCCVSETKDKEHTTDIAIKIPTIHTTDCYVKGDYIKHSTDIFVAPTPEEIGGDERIDFWVCNCFNTDLILEQLFNIGIFAKIQWVGFSPVSPSGSKVGFDKVTPEAPGIVEPNNIAEIIGYIIDENTGQFTVPDIAYPCEIRIFTAEPLSEERENDVEQLLLDHNCEGLTDEQIADEQDQDDLDRLEELFVKCPSSLTSGEKDEALCILMRLFIRKERNIII